MPKLFDVQGARAAGYTDAEIADHLAQADKFDIAGARKAGYSDAEIIAHLSAPKSASDQVPVSAEERAFSASHPQAAPTTSDQVGRALGLTARYGIEGASAGAGMLTDPIINAIGGAVRSVTGGDYDPVTIAKIGRSVSDALGLPQPETATERVVGAMARGVAGAAAPTAIAGQVANVASGTAKGVAQQMAAQPAVQMASGAAAGGAGQAVAENGGGAAAQLAAALAAGVGAPAAAGGAARAMKAVRGGTIAPEQQAILDAGERAGVPVMTSDVLPPKTFMGKHGQAVTERVPVVGTGAVREGQQGARQQAVADLAQQYGAPSYEAMVTSIKGKVGSIKKAAGRVIDQTGQQLDAVGAVTPAKSIQAVDDAIAKLNAPGVYNPKAAEQVKVLTDLKDVLASGQQTFSALRQSRTAVKEIIDAVDPAGRSQLPSYAKKLVAGVYSAMKSDMDDFARANLPPEKFDKLVKANGVYGEEATLLKASRLKNVLDKGDVTPEVVRNMIYSNKPSENRILYDAMGTAGRQQVKAALIDDAAQKALRNGEFNPNAFAVELAKHNKKLDAFFRGDEREALKGFVRLMQVTRRAQDAAAAPTTTGATVLPYLMGGAAVANFAGTVSAAVTAGGLARVYESAPVRNLLLKLNNAAPRSPEEAKHVQALMATFREEAQRHDNSKAKPANNF